jgi:CRISPR system Cascade subunit CasE
MHLTKAILRRDPGRNGAIAAQLLDAADRDCAHRLVWTLFSQTGEEARDFLYRQIEPGEYLVLSQHPPNDPSGLWAMTVRAFDPSFATGDRLRFLLRANPAETVAQKGAKRGLRVDAVMNAKHKVAGCDKDSFDVEAIESAALTWLKKRSDGFGVRLLEGTCQINSYRVERLTSGFRWRDTDIRFGVVDYEGEFEVVDPLRLSAAILKGIGKAKAYGCGLMLVRPA